MKVEKIDRHPGDAKVNKNSAINVKKSLDIHIFATFAISVYVTFVMVPWYFSLNRNAVLLKLHE